LRSVAKAKLEAELSGCVQLGKYRLHRQHRQQHRGQWGRVSTSCAGAACDDNGQRGLMGLMERARLGTCPSRPPTNADGADANPVFVLGNGNEDRGHPGVPFDSGGV
jgi:hypothetical protein